MLTSNNDEYEAIAIVSLFENGVMRNKNNTKKPREKKPRERYWRGFLAELPNQYIFGGNCMLRRRLY